LRKTLVSLFSEVLGEAKIPALQLASQYSELSDMIAARAREAFAQLGLELVRLVVENISLPEEVEKAIDARSQMNVVGDLNSYTNFRLPRPSEVR
jgi:membrane protease subunit (stomatin/prohibitin family)